MINPRKNPMTMTTVGYGEHAINLGAKRLGAALEKCLSEVNLLMQLPPDSVSQNVMAVLRRNIQGIMGLENGQVNKEDED